MKIIFKLNAVIQTNKNNRENQPSKKTNFKTDCKGEIV